MDQYVRRSTLLSAKFEVHIVCGGVLKTYSLHLVDHEGDTVDDWEVPVVGTW